MAPAGYMDLFFLVLHEYCLLSLGQTPDVFDLKGRLFMGSVVRGLFCLKGK